MIYSTEEIVRSYREAKDPEKQIKVLADLKACTVKEIRQVLVGEGVLPRETEKKPEKKPGRRPRAKKPSDATPDAPAQTAADVEETEETQDIAKHPAPKQRAVTVEELRVVNTDRLLELAKADEDGRLFLLPMEPGRSMLCQEYFERPWVMKNVTLCVQYKSSAGIIFYMGYDVFHGLVERGRITPLSQEGEETLKGEQK